MKKLLIASSVLAALTANVAFAAPLTENGGTIEFIGEITDTTCWVDVQNTDEGATAGPTDTSNVVLLPVVTKSAFATNGTAGRTPFFLHVHSHLPDTHPDTPCTIGSVAGRNASTGLPDGSVKAVTKVKALFGGNLQSGDVEKYASRKGVTAGVAIDASNYGNVDTVTGYLNNIASTVLPATRSFADGLTPLTPSDNGAATNVKLRLLDSDYRPIRVGDVNDQIANNKAKDLNGDTVTKVNSAGVVVSTTTGTTSLPYYVEYIQDGGTVTAGMVRSFVVYDLMYE